MKLLFILAFVLNTCINTAFADNSDNMTTQAQPDLRQLSQILGISLLSAKAEVDHMIATKGKNWHCERIDVPEQTDRHGIRKAWWKRTCFYQPNSAPMQHQRFEIDAVGGIIHRIVFVDRVFDLISIDQWKNQPARMKDAYGPSLDSAQTEVLKTQDASSRMQYQEIDAGLKLTVDRNCDGQPYQLAVSTITIEQGSVTTSRFSAERESYKNQCRIR